MSDLLPVRAAEAGDEDALFRLCLALYAENASHSTMVEGAVRGVLRRAIAKDRAVAGVIERDGGIVGCLLLHVERQWYSDQVFLQELFNFVLPEHRSSTAAKSLIAWAKAAALRLRMPLMVGVISSTRTEAKVRLYQQQLRKVGAFFIFNEEAAPLGDASIVVG